MARKSRNLAPILTLIAGVLVLAFPDFLRWAIGLYLIIIALVELFDRN